MGQSPQKSTMSKDSLEERLKADKVILIIFSVLLAITVFGSSLSFVLIDSASAMTLMSGFFGGLAVTFLFAGIPAYIHHRKAGLTSRRTIRLWMVFVSLGLALALALALSVVAYYWPEELIFPDVEIRGTLFTAVMVVGVTFVVFLCMSMAALILAFGAVGVMTAIERRITPWILRRIAESGSKEKLGFVDRGLRWFFDVPDILDVKTLNIKSNERRTRITWQDMRPAVALQLLFGLVLGIYVSLNPFISDRSPEALVGIFSMLSNAALVIPVIILPLFIYRRLGVNIKGQTKEFTLYNGIRARMFQSYFAVGTIVVIVRLSISEVSTTAYLEGFFSFMFMLVLVSILCTFVYLNYFENALAEDIAMQFRGMVDQKVPSEPQEPQ